MMGSAKAEVSAWLLVTTLAVSTTATAAQWANPQLLSTADEVKKGLESGQWVAVDCRDLEDYVKGHIPGAISFGQRCKKVLRDVSSRVYADVSKYEKLFSKVGIGNDTHVVFYYDGLDSLTDATVAFWIMEYLGHDKAHVLNGGIDAWRQAGNRLDNKPVALQPATFKANLNPAPYATTDEIFRIARGEERIQLIDSRTEEEHKGKDIQSIRGGHVPHTTLNVSHLDTLRQERNKTTGKSEVVAYIDPEPAEKVFGGLDRSQRTVAHCQTGTRSTLTYLQLRALGFKDPANWDDSWRVYGSMSTAPIDDEQWFNFASLNEKIEALESKVKTLEKPKN